MAIERFTKDHEWIRADGGVGIVGITVYAQSQLGDVVFIDLPEIGRKVSQGEAVAVVESVKAASDVYAPVAGEIIEVNSDLIGQPALVNEDAEGRAWFFKMRITTEASVEEILDRKLMDRAGYDAFVKEAS